MTDQYNYPPIDTENRMNVQPYYPTQPQMPAPTYYQPQTVGTICPSCNKITSSYTKLQNGQITWIWCFLLFCVTGICCWIPFCCDECKEQQIKCSQCHQKKAVI